mmetsp:Transcript_1174/g.3736  ORF Transcript_1174/g.3736 Transcript_1174/m.3736 type:complete len:251 (+) Transcript_1174:1113-1865(+)
MVRSYRSMKRETYLEQSPRSLLGASSSSSSSACAICCEVRSRAACSCPMIEVRLIRYRSRSKSSRKRRSLLMPTAERAPGCVAASAAGAATSRKYSRLACSVRASASWYSPSVANPCSGELPTRPEGTEVKNGPPSSRGCDSRRGRAARKWRRSDVPESWASLVSSLVETTTVRPKVGSTSPTSCRTAELCQQRVSSTQRMTRSAADICATTSSRTARALAAALGAVDWAAESKSRSPGVSMMLRLGQYL